VVGHNVSSDRFTLGYGITGLAHKATLWKDGEETQLDSPNGCNSAAWSMCVSDGDVYAVGRYELNAALWKNGRREDIHYIEDGVAHRASASSVAVYDGDVYVSGSVSRGRFDLPGSLVWKNGELLHWLIGSFPAGSSTSIFFPGGDMYVGGWTYLGFATRLPTIWKNGEPTLLVGPGWYDDLCDGVTSVFVDGDDVYATSNCISSIRDEYGNLVGVAVPVAALWKNGAETNIGGRYSSSGADSVAVLNGDVYVAGWAMDQERKNQVAVLWVNGARYDLTDQAQGPFGRSRATSVAVREKAGPAPIAR
jgi:hypothetical protein